MSAEDVLFHGQEVRLVNGERIAVNPWGIKTGRRMVRRVKTIWRIYRDVSRGAIDLEQLLEDSYGEVVSLVADSIGLSIQDLEDESRFLFEDLVVLVTAIVEVNFTGRPEFTAKLLALFRQVGKGAEDGQSIPATPTSDSQPPSNS
jgi:hypothetical protein